MSADYKWEDHKVKHGIVMKTVPRPSETKAKSFEALTNISDKHKQIIKALEETPELTRAELATATNLRLSSVCGRVNELIKKKLVKVSGTKIDVASGRNVETLGLCGIIESNGSD